MASRSRLGRDSAAGELLLCDVFSFVCGVIEFVLTTLLEMQEKNEQWFCC